MEFSGNYSFCKSEFWNTSKTWEGEHLEFTTCFSNTIMASTPGVFLLVIQLIRICYWKNRSPKSAHLNWLNISKVILLALAIPTCFILLIKMFHGKDTIDPSEVFSLVVKLVTLCIAIALSLLNISKGIRTSGVMFFFWLLCSIFWYPFKFQIGMDDLFHIVLYIVTISSFLLTFFIEPVSVTENTSQETLHPRQESSFPSKLTFFWFFPFIWKGRQILEVEDLWGLSKNNLSRIAYEKLVTHWDSRSMLLLWIRGHPTRQYSSFTDQKYSVIWPLVKGFGWTILSSNFLMLCYILVLFRVPKLQREIVNFLANETDQVWHGYFYAAFFFVLLISLTLLKSRQAYKDCLVSLRIQSALFHAIFRKALSLRRDSFIVGDITNLLAVDVKRIIEVIPNLHNIWSIPVRLSWTIWLLWEYLGLALIAGILLILVLAISTYFIVKLKVAKLESVIMKLKDSRGKITYDLCNNAKVLKMLSCEKEFEKDLLEKRNEEIKHQKDWVVWHSLSNMAWNIAGFLVPLVSYIAYECLKKPKLYIEEIVEVIALFNLLKLPLSTVPTILPAITQAYVSLKRFNKFINAEEFKDKINHVSTEDDSEHLRGQFTKIQQDRELGDDSGTENEGNVTFEASKGQTYFEVQLGESEHLQGKFTKIQQDSELEDDSDTNNEGWGTFEANYTNETEHDSLSEDESDKQDEESKIPKKSYAVTVTNVTVSYRNEVLLKDMNINIEEETMVGVTGISGSGKSSLISGLLGEIKVNKGVINILGNISVLSQPPLILNDTIRNNILFGSAENITRYKQVIKACYLQYYFEKLPNGDKMLAGEKGGSLNGGLKVLVALARAIFKEADIYLLDDPFSALDLCARNHILKEVIGREGFLKNKVRIVTTDSITHLRDADRVLLLRDKKIDYDLTADQLEVHIEQNILQGPVEINTDFEAVLREELLDVDPRRKANKTQDESEKQCPDKSEKVKSVEGRLNAYKGYLQFTKKEIWLLILFHFGNKAAYFGAYFWMVKWINDDAKKTSNDKLYYLFIYMLLGIINSLFLVGAETLLRWTLLRASFKLYCSALKGVVNAPFYNFFDSNSSGQFIARFAGDVDTLDYILPTNIHNLIYSSFGVIAVIFSIILKFEWYSIFTGCLFIVLLVIFFIIIMVPYVFTSKQLRHLESKSSELVYSHLSDSYLGAASIRVFGVANKFIIDFEEKVDIKQRCKYLLEVANIWVRVWTEVLGNLVIVLTIVMGTFFKNQMLQPGEFPIMVLIVNYAFEIVQSLLKAAVEAGNIGTNVVAVERIKEYSEIEPEEDENFIGHPLPKCWPLRGDIHFSSFTAKYPKNNICALNQLTFKIEHGDKVGLIGPTGAGKSSLCLSLLRMLNCSGTITIDEVDIFKLTLQDLRSRLSIVTQDPSLFNGTLKKNLDPRRVYEDDEALLNALNDTGLKVKIIKMIINKLEPEKVYKNDEELLKVLTNRYRRDQIINFEITDGGAKFSVGERQLICLARALLCKSKVVFLDEATSAVDQNLDQEIQEILRTNFKDSTVLIVAHRLTTIMGCNRIMLIENGQLKEFDTQENLRKNENSDYYKMLKSAKLLENINQPGTSRDFP